MKKLVFYSETITESCGSILGKTYISRAKMFDIMLLVEIVVFLKFLCLE